MKKLSFKDIPASDKKMLKDELGKWLIKANDRWCDNKKNKELINY